MAATDDLGPQFRRSKQRIWPGDITAQWDTPLSTPNGSDDAGDSSTSDDAGPGRGDE
jgi:hypothetical protein